MKYIKNHIPKSKDKRPGIKITPEYITIHSTGNPKSTAQNERDWLTNPSNTRTASWHIVVDEKEAIEAIPLTELAYHAGNRNGNNKSIGIEICESGNRQKTLENAVKLVAKMLHERNWGVNKLRRHFDWSGKNCPRILNYNNWAGWTKFKNDVQKELNKLKGGSTMANKNTPSTWAKEAWEWAKRQKYMDGNRPKDNMTREEFATVLHRLFKDGKLK